MKVEMYKYNISGWYFSNDMRKPFNKDVDARDNIEAMKIVIGELAWKESIEGNAFLLDVIHYE
jgi:hypothetical protein